MHRSLPEYEIRFLDITSVRQMFMQAVSQHANDPLVRKMVLMDEAEEVFSWIVEHAIHRILHCRVDKHYPYDLGEHMFHKVELLEPQLGYTLGPLRLRERMLDIKHVKVMVLDNLLMFAFTTK